MFIYVRSKIGCLSTNFWRKPWSPPLLGTSPRPTSVRFLEETQIVRATPPRVASARCRAALAGVHRVAWDGRDTVGGRGAELVGRGETCGQKVTSELKGHPDSERTVIVAGVIQWCL